MSKIEQLVLAVKKRFGGNKDKEMLEFDELLNELAAPITLERKMAAEWNEPKIYFPPTFKLLYGHMDSQAPIGAAYKRQRVPAWTDRIIYSCKTKKSMKNLAYNSARQRERIKWQLS